MTLEAFLNLGFWSLTRLKVSGPEGVSPFGIAQTSAVPEPVEGTTAKTITEFGSATIDLV